MEAAEVAKATERVREERASGYLWVRAEGSAAHLGVSASMGLPKLAQFQLNTQPRKHVGIEIQAVPHKGHLTLCDPSA